jgi:UDP-glucose:O-linked fucose beta-1,3-glucosyltransferase
MEEKEQLEEQLRAVMDKHKYKRRQIRELTEDLQVGIIAFVFCA